MEWNKVRRGVINFSIVISLLLAYGCASRGRSGSSTRNAGSSKHVGAPKKQKIYKYIIVPDTQNTLYGNKCATEATHKYGFEYLPTPKSQLKTERESQIMFHNLFTNLSITLTRGPFWKLALKKKLKDCKRKSRDMNG